MNEKLIIYNTNKTIAARKYLAESKSNAKLNLAMSFDGFNDALLKRNSLIPEIARLKAQKLPYEDLLKNLDAVEGEIEAILKKNGMTKEDIKPQYYCKKCNDSGFVDGVRCKCFFDMRNTLRQREMNAEQLCESFDNISSSVFSESEKANYELLCNFLRKTIAAFPNLKTRFLVFSGATGTGKTYLAKAIAGEFEKKGFESTFISSFNLSNAFLKYYSDFNDENVDSLSPLVDCDLLVIDDLGSEIVKNISERFLVNLLNERNAFHKLTIITTNLAPNDLISVYSERVYSRIIDKNVSKLINFEFSDLRKSV